MIVLAAIVIALTVAGSQVWRSRSTDRLLKDRRLAKVVVEIHTGETFQGVLVACDDRVVVLKNVTALVSAEALPKPIDGELLIPRGDVKFIQRP